MAQGVTMGDIEWFGSDGGRLAVAFGAGWAACLAFLTGLVIIAFKFVTKSHEDRLKAAEAAHAECRRDNEELKREMAILRNTLLLHGSGPLRSELQAALSELHIELRELQGKSDERG